MAGDLLGRLNAVSMENVLFKENPRTGHHREDCEIYVIEYFTTTSQKIHHQQNLTNIFKVI
jgi:hypothetical protein